VAPVRNLTLRTTTLDDVFLELTGNHIRSADHEPGDHDLEDRELVEVPA
jgi:hypothetical protein